MKYNIDFSNYDKRPLYFRDLKAGDLFIPVDDPETFILIQLRRPVTLVIG